MIKFGPSGFCKDFESKYKSTEDMPKWLVENNLDCYELSFTNGVRMSNETAEKFGKLFKDAGIEVSVHAPYYINFSNPDPEAIEKSNMHIIASLQKMKFLGAKKLVFHPGTMLKLSREEAFDNIRKNLENLVKILDEMGMSDFTICPETMGKHGQIGTVEEIAELCTIDDRIMPTLDFGHINSFTGGTLKTCEDYENVFMKLKEKLKDRFNKVHIHFSKIEYGKKGEIRHLTFDDTTYGPEFEPLAKVLKKLDVDACVVCESSGTQTRDAVIMKNIYSKC